MSHIRNLLHKPSGHEYSSPPLPAAVPLAAVPDHNFTATATVPAPVFALQNCPVEVANLGPEQRLVVHAAPDSPAADRFRFLRMRLKEHWQAGKLKKLLVTGPLAHEGKSTVTLNLATALAERGKRNVLVVEGDFHHSSLSASLRLKPWAGLAECLVDNTIAPLSAVRRIEPLGWYFLPAGKTQKNPTELLQGRGFGTVMQQLSPYFDWVLVDSPPVVPLTDAIALQPHVDASLLVVRAGQTSREAVEQAVGLLGKENIVGIVLNGVEKRDQPSYQQRYYAYSGGRDNED